MSDAKLTGGDLQRIERMLADPQSSVQLSAILSHFLERRQAGDDVRAAARSAIRVAAAQAKTTDRP